MLLTLCGAPAWNHQPFTKPSTKPKRHYLPEPTESGNQAEGCMCCQCQDLHTFRHRTIPMSYSTSSSMLLRSRTHGFESRWRHSCVHILRKTAFQIWQNVLVPHSINHNVFWRLVQRVCYMSSRGAILNLQVGHWHHRTCIGHGVLSNRHRHNFCNPPWPHRILCPFAVSIFAGSLADAVGRPRAVTIGFCVSGLGAAIEAASIHIAMFIVGRIIIGIGIRLYLSTVVVYICELAPPAQRGVCLRWSKSLPP